MCFKFYIFALLTLPAYAVTYDSLDELIAGETRRAFQKAFHYTTAAVCYPLKAATHKEPDSDFEKKLQVNLLKETVKDIFRTPLFTIDDMRTQPELFLKYIYYITNIDFTPSYDDEPGDRFTHRLFDLRWMPVRGMNDDSPVRWAQDLKKKCLDARIDGYSALGAAAIARYHNEHNKRQLITILKQRGLEPTQQDLKLINLKLSDSEPFLQATTSDTQPLLNQKAE